MGNLVAERWLLRPVRTKHLTAILTESGFRHYSRVGTVLKSSCRYSCIIVGWVDYLKWTNVHEDYIVLKTRKAKNSQVSIRAIPFTPTLKKIFETLPRKGEFFYQFDYRKE